MLNTLSSEEDQMKLFDVCSAYERHIMSLRETYESAIQAANLKIFIANNEIEKLKEADISETKPRLYEFPDSSWVRELVVIDNSKLNSQNERKNDNNATMIVYMYIFTIFTCHQFT